MKEKLAKAQWDYMIAKALKEILEKQIADIEQAYIKKHHITNANGWTPGRIYCIDDDAVFNEANEATSQEIEASGLDVAVSEAGDRLKDAKDTLVFIGLELAPANVREALGKGARTRYIIREEIFDAVYHLNPNTLP